MDLNNDGYRDILSGSYSRMETNMAGLFQVLWGQPGGQFKETAVLKGTDDQPLIIPVNSESDRIEKICTRPTAVDWNGDSKLDLVVGNFGGTFYLFLGEGGGKFAPKAEPLKAGNELLKLKGHHSDPFVVDWDGDGDLDIVSGSSEGGVQWAENTAGRGKAPVLKQFQSIIKPGSAAEEGRLLSEQELTAPASSSRVWVDDFNDDGKLDILLGDDVTLRSLAKGVSKKEYARKYDKWKKDLEAAQKARTETANDEKRQQEAYKRINEIYEQREEFMHEDRTGYVWLYKQK